MTMFRAVVCVLFTAITIVATASAQDKAAFDPNDGAKSGEYIASLWMPYFDAVKNRNDVAKRSALFTMDATLQKQIVGKDVDWVVFVSAIKPEGIHFKDIFDKKASPRRLSVTTAMASKIKPFTRQIGNHAFPAIGDWVLNAKTNDPIRLQGKIVGFRRDEANSAGITQLLFGDYRLSPVEKK